ncbi:ABC transporter substrate-binding protein [Streptosporangium sp. NBC_01639]|uniref:ABC transporter substrate-binding protein n=1 Tax=Streptosporangium sp. NBC_01639 TaxID=2975948 RepID=UPI00387018E9|nr:ABC transporter substrate-binding protein [Streptosporangium sp. NBC_01639]
MGTGPGRRMRAVAGGGAEFQARVVVDAGRRVLTGDAAFFTRNRPLVDHARRATAEGPAVLRYYWRSADGVLFRVTVETSDTERGPVSGLHAERSEPPWGLTSREHEALTCVAVGMTNPEIAGHLGCAARTVATHVEHILAKLGAPSRAAAAALAVAEDALLAPLPRWAGSGITAVARVTRDQDDAAEPAPPPTTDRSGPPSGTVRRSPTTRSAGRRPIRLGAIYPLDGPRRFDALAMRRGAAIAVDELNARGGIGGRRLDHLVTEVSGDSDADLLAAVDHLRAHNVDAITLGNVSPRHHLGAITLAAEYRAPLIHSMVSPDITEHVYDNPGVLGQTFQVCATETAYLSGFVRTLDLLTGSGQWNPPNRRLVALVREGGHDAGHGVVLDELAATHGWDLVTVLPIPDTGVPWPDVVASVQRDDPAAVFVCTYVEEELRRFLQEMRKARSRSLVHTVWTPTIPHFEDRMGGLAEGLLWSTVIGTYGDPVSARFMHRYRRAFGEEPGSGSAAIHYDMIHMLAGAWAAVDRPWDFGAVVRSLRETVHRGAAGPYYFGGRGQRALAYPDDTWDASLAHAHLVHQVQGGRSQVIAPVEIAQRRFQPPAVASDG